MALKLTNLVVALLCAFAVAGCSLPRGAAMQSEILKSAEAENPDIAVYAVTRGFLQQVAKWPVTGGFRHYGWISHGAATGDLAIQPLDMVDLVIWDSEGNSLLTADSAKLVEMKGIRVNQAGMIFIPYVGELRVAGRTADNARRQIQREMEAIVPSAQVQLSLVAGTRSSVSLVSGAGTPGSYPLPEGHYTVLNLISQAGGPKDLRNPQVRLTRNGKSYKTSLSRIYENPSADTILRGGDKISIENDPRYFRALGASGTEEILYFDKSEISALDAMSMIGGVSDNRANLKGVLILREYSPKDVRGDSSGPSNTRTVFTIDLTTSDGLFSAGNFTIHPKDTVLVTESPVNSTRTVFGLIGSVFGLASTVTSN